MTDKLATVGECGLHRRTPYAILNVSQTQFSIARHYGGCKFNNEHYVYEPTDDSLVRDDVLRWLKRQQKAARKAKPKPQQPSLFQE